MYKENTPKYIIMEKYYIYIDELNYFKHYLIYCLQFKFNILYYTLKNNQFFIPFHFNIF